MEKEKFCRRVSVCVWERKGEGGVEWLEVCVRGVCVCGCIESECKIQTVRVCVCVQKRGGDDDVVGVREGVEWLRVCVCRERGCL